MMAAIAAWYALIDQGTVSGGTVGGTADAITLANSPTVGAYAAGQRYLFRAGSANTTAVTLAVDGLAATALRWHDTALVADDIAAGDLVLCVYDASTSRFQMLNPPRVSLVTVAATQAQMEAATNLIAPVTAGRLQYHPGVAKCWGYITVAAGSPTLQVSQNLTSITDTATGRLTLTIATDFSAATWTAQVSIEIDSSGNQDYPTLVSNGTQAAGSVEIRNFNSGSLKDPAAWHFAGFGDQ